MKAILALGAFLLVTISAQAEHGQCRQTRTSGVGYFGAKQNCELILSGDAFNCNPQGPRPDSLWTCDCTFSCQSSGGQSSGGNSSGYRETTTWGVGYYGAKQNCELILSGNSYDCRPQGPNPDSTWVCRCRF